MTATSAPAVAARPRVRPLFLADWTDAVFVHFRVPPAALRENVPLPLDLHDGDAIVSLVAFTQRRLRPSMGGRFAALLAAPLAAHPFLNVRTYVRHDGTAGIFFIAEWIPNRIAAFIGPRTYGLPYRLGRLRYGRTRDGGELVGQVTGSAGGAFQYRAALPHPPAVARATPGSFDEFLLERYTAFTHRRGVTRRFDVAHDP